MIRSMTGFGDASMETEAGVLRAEIRTVNHRFFSLNVRSPAALDRFEPKIREWLKRELARGHVNLTYRLEGDGESGSRLALDTDRARQYLEVLRQLADELEVPGTVDLGLLAQQPDLVIREQPEAAVVAESAVEAVTLQAARAVVAMREAEGRNLRNDLEARLDAIGDALGLINERGPQRLVEERDRLRRAIAELAAEAGADEDRVAREIAILADRWDIGEEVVRLRSHIDHFRGMLDDDPAEPVGKRLSFLVQEMHREANTIGSKANDAPIEHGVVDIKNEIERLREQVENVE